MQSCINLTVQLYVFPAVSKAPLKENLDTASLNFGAEVDRHNGQLDAIWTERLHMAVVHKAEDKNEGSHSKIFKTFLLLSFYDISNISYILDKCKMYQYKAIH